MDKRQAELKAEAMLRHILASQPNLLAQNTGTSNLVNNDEAGKNVAANIQHIFNGLTSMYQGMEQ